MRKFLKWVKSNTYIGSAGTMEWECWKSTYGLALKILDSDPVAERR